MKTATSWILIVAALALAAWLLWPEPPPERGSAGGVPAGADAADKGASPAERRPEPITSERFVPPGEDEAATRRARSFPVVCRMPDGSPAGGATVAIHDAGGSALEAAESGAQALPPGRPLATLRCDDDGRVDLGGQSVGPRLLLARRGDYAARLAVRLRPRRGSGTERAGAPPRPREIVLSRARELTVRVTTSRGRPVAGATVVALDPSALGPLSHSFESGAGNAPQLHHARTDDAGEARFLVTENEGAEWFRSASIDAFALIIGSEREIRGARWEDGRAHIELTVPASRHVDVVITDAAGRPLNERFLVEWTADLEEDWEVWTEDVSFDIDAWQERYVGLEAMTSHWGALLRRGRGVLGRFLAERRFSVKVSSERREPAIHVVDVPLGGPRHELRLRAGPERPFLRARVEDPDGAPCCGVKIEVRYYEKGNLQAVYDQVTDASGRIEESFLTGTEGRLVVRAPTGGHEAGQARFAEATLEMTGKEQGLLAPEIVLRLEARPLMAAGRLRDSAGAAIEDGLVKVLEHDPDREEELRAAVWWEPAGEDGRFRVMAVARPQCTYEISAVSPRGVAPPRAFAPGSSALALELSPPPVTTGALRGRLEWSIPRMEGEVEISLRRESDGRISWLEYPGDGWILARDLAPGDYELRVMLHDLPVVRVGGLRVVAGEEARPPAIQGLEVGRDFREARVRVRDAGGEGLGGSLVEWSERTDDESVEGWRKDAFTDAAGRAAMIVPRWMPLQVKVEREHYPEFVEERPEFPMEVQLKKELRVDLRWQPPLPRPSGTKGWQVCLARPLSEELGDALRTYAARTGRVPPDLETHEIVSRAWIGVPFDRAEFWSAHRGVLFVLARPQLEGGGLGPASVLGELRAEESAETVEESLDLTAETRDALRRL